MTTHLDDAEILRVARVVRTLLDVPRFNSYAFFPLMLPLAHSDFNGDSFSTTAKTEVAMRVSGKFFGLPADAKAALIKAVVQDSASAANDCYIILAPNNTAGSGIYYRCSGLTNDAKGGGTYVVPLTQDSPSKLYYQALASGATTLDVWLTVWGYWL